MKPIASFLSRSWRRLVSASTAALAAIAVVSAGAALAPAPVAAQSLIGPSLSGDLNRPVAAERGSMRRTGRVLDTVGLVGDWEGTYFDCPSCDPSGMVRFEASFFAEGAGVTGDSIEPNTFGAPEVGSLFAFWSGEVFRGGVRLIKTYDGTGGVDHDVDYIGRFETPDLILGRWRVGRTSGRFEMVRRRALLN